MDRVVLPAALARLERAGALPILRHHDSGALAVHDVATTARVAGNAAAAAVARMGRAAGVQRAATASSAADAAAIAPDGPLAELRDELDDTFVDETRCLTLLTQLGTGERTLVRRDTAMLTQMVDAFDAKEMSTAVQQLDFPLKDSLHWIGRAGTLSDAGEQAIMRLIAAATSQQIAELVGWEEVRAQVEAAVSANPLTFAPLQADNAMVLHLLRDRPAFFQWALRKGTASEIVRHIAAHDPAASIAALKTSSSWTPLLEQLPRGTALGVPDRAALRTLFFASTDGEERRQIFAQRFDTRAPAELDWVAAGEAQWNAAEQLAGTGTDEEIQAAIAAGQGPASIADAVAAEPEGPLAKLRGELDETFVDEEACLRYLGELTDRERFFVRGDPTMLRQIGDAFNEEEMARALEFLRFPKLGDAIRFLQGSGEAGDLPAATWRSLLQGATGQQVAELIGWQEMFDVVRNHAGSAIDPLAIPGLLADDGMAAHVIATYPAYSDWVLARSGGQAYLRYLAAHTPATTVPALITANKLTPLLADVPTGSQLPPPERTAMYTVFQHAPGIAEKKTLMMKRWNLEEIGTKDGGPEFDAEGLDRLWQLFDRLPAAHTADSETLDRLMRGPSGTGAPSGVAGDRTGMPNYLSVSYRSGPGGNMGDTETGQYTNPGDAMQGTNVLDGVAIHETGHRVDAAHSYSDPSGRFGSRADLGAWRVWHTTSADSARPFLNELASASGVNAGLNATEQADLVTAAADYVVNRRATPRAAFEQQSSDWGGTGDKWQPLWNKVSASSFITALASGKRENSPWQNPPAAVGDRYYHEAYNNKWVSYLTSSRGTNNLSWYQFRDNKEWFAEMYATFYLTPNDPGVRLRDWNRDAYDWFVANVDRGHSTQAAP